MIDRGKKNVLGIGIDAVDYEGALARVVAAARKRQPLQVTALAVHGVMTGAFNPHHRYRLNAMDLVMPDGQPVRWAMNFLYRSGLKDRVYGPTFTLRLCRRAARENLKIFLYGSTPKVLKDLEVNLKRQFPDLEIAGSMPSLFRRSSDAEKKEIAGKIRASGANMVFVGLGCPRQEIWVHECTQMVGLPCMAVGAAFDFHSGHLKQAPGLLQRYALEWFFRLVQEPRRLWKRYVLLNPVYLVMLTAQILGIRSFEDRGNPPPRSENYA